MDKDTALDIAEETYGERYDAATKIWDNAADKILELRDIIADEGRGSRKGHQALESIKKQKTIQKDALKQRKRASRQFTKDKTLIRGRKVFVGRKGYGESAAEAKGFATERGEQYRGLIRNPKGYPPKIKTTRDLPGLHKLAIKKGITQKSEMMYGGAYKGKKHSYAAGGKVNKLKF